MANTTQRGLGYHHQQTRKRLLAAHIEGTVCPFHGSDPKCPGPMYLAQGLDADHSLARVNGGRVADRLAHSACNRRAGQRLSAQRRATPKRRNSRSW